MQGLYDSTTNTIYLASDLPEDVQLHVLFHELAHALYDSFNRLNEEAVCDVLASYFVKLSGLKNVKEFLNRMEEK